MSPNQPFLKKYKKEIIIVSIAVLIFIFLVYFLFFYNKKTINNTENTNLQNKSGFSFSNLISNIFNKDATTTDGSIAGENNSEYYFEGLIKVWDKPVAGYNFYYKENKILEEVASEVFTESFSLKTTIQFVDSDTGFVYEKDLLSPTSTPVQVTSASFPNVIKAYFLNDKNGYKSRVFIQYLSENNIIKTVSFTIPEYRGSTANIMNKVNLPDNINYISISPDNKKLVYIVKKNKITDRFQDVYTDWYYISNTNDSYGKRFYSSQMSNWKLNVLDDGSIYAYNTDSAFDTNSLYKISLDGGGTGSLSQIFSNHTGMSFSINKNNLLVSIFTGAGLKLYENDSFTGKSFSDSSLNNLNFVTLVNKCTDNITDGDELLICSVPKDIKNYEYGLPDAWYQGMTSWEDNLYVKNTEYPNGELLYDFKKDGNILDIIDAKDLKINNTKSHLSFINKNDASLWTLNIENILYSNSD